MTQDTGDGLTSISDNHNKTKIQMPQYKPSKFITRLTTELTTNKERIAQLEAERNAMPAKVAAAVATALQIAAVEHQHALDAEHAIAAALRQNLDEVMGNTDGMAVRIAGLETTIEGLKSDRNDDATTIGQLRQLVADLEARGPMLDQLEAAIAAKEVDLRAIVERVESRMRNREREEASAILNRRSLAAVTPARIR